MLKPSGRGRKSHLIEAQIDEIEAFMGASKGNRRRTYKQLAEIFPFSVMEYSIKQALKKRGYSRRIALHKPALSDINKAARLEWAREYLYWTKEQWFQSLWTNQTSLKAGPHRRTRVTGRPGCQ